MTLKSYQEYVMGVIAKKEPQTFKKMFGNQTGYYSLMKPLNMGDLDERIKPFMLSYSDNLVNTINKTQKHYKITNKKNLRKIRL